MRNRNSIECWIARSDGKVLLLHVSATESPPVGFWQPITGGVKAGERATAAATREVREETALVVAPNTLEFVVDGLIVPIDRDFQVTKTVFIARVDATLVTTNPLEHDSHDWYDKSDVAKALSWDSNLHTWSLVRSRLT